MNNTQSEPKKNDPHVPPGHDLVVITLDNVEKTVTRGPRSVADLKQLVGLPADAAFGELVRGELNLLSNEKMINIKGGEVFVAPVPITIDKKSFYVVRGNHTVAELKKLGGVEQSHRLARLVNDKPEPLANDGTVEIAGGEAFVSEVSIRISGKEFLVWRGRYSVAQLKQIGGVPLAYELEQKVGGKLVPLDDGASVEICGDEVFISHPRDAKSS